MCKRLLIALIFLGGLAFSTRAIDIDALFSGANLTSTIERDPKTVTLLATGDVMLGRSVYAKMQRRFDYAFPFRKTYELTRAADITLINLECPLVPDAEINNEGLKFSSPPQAVDGLTFAGVDVVNLANNHILDQGEEGLIFTKELLEAKGLAFCDEEDAAIKEVRGTRFAFVGFNFLSPALTLDEAAAAIKNVREQAQVVIASVHFGNEYTYFPNLRQKVVAHALVDAGADLIIGHHPHYVQGVEIYKDKFISYSLGNFVFDQNWSDETQAGVMGQYIFNGSHLVKVNFIPVEIKELCQPRLADIGMAQAILNHMKSSTDSIPR